MTELQRGLAPKAYLVMKKYLKFKLSSLLILTLLVAIAMAVYLQRTSSIESLEEADWIQLRSKTEDKYVFDFEADVTQHQTEQILDLLDVGGKIDFYDSKLTISDPGIYVSLKKISQDEFAIYCGNHGWTRGYFAIKKAEAYEYFWISHDDNLASQTEWPHSDMRLWIRGKVPSTISRQDNNIYKHIRKLIADKKP